MMDASARLPSERKSAKHEIYIIPLKTKVGTRGGVKEHMLVATFIVERRLENDPGERIWEGPKDGPA